MFQSRAEVLRASFLAFLLSLPGSADIKGQEDGRLESSKVRRVGELGSSKVMRMGELGSSKVRRMGTQVIKGQEDGGLR